MINSGTSVDIGGDLLGQVVIGEHNIVVRAEQSVVNVLPPHQRPQPVLRTRINLLPHQATAPIGRDAEVTALRAATTAVRLTQVYGPPGSGKTTLIRHLAGQFSDTENTVFLLAAGRNTADVLQEVFQACYDCPGYRPDPITLRQLMAGVPLRLLLDDLDLPPQLHDTLLDGVPGATVVCTSAQRSVWHEGQALELVGLGYEPSVELLAAVLGRPLADAELATAAELWRTTSGSPLLLVRAAINARPGTDGVPTLPHAAELAELLPRVLAGLSAPARSVVSTLTVAGTAPAALLSALVGDPGTCPAALAELTSLGVVLESPWGYQLAPGIQAGLPQEAYPDVARVAQLADWFEAWTRQPQRSPLDVAAQTPLIIALIDAAVWFGRPDIGARLAKITAPIMACSLYTGAWEQVLAHGRTAAELAGDKATLAYLNHEDGVRGLVTGAYFAAAAAIGVAITLWTELGMTGHVALAQQAQVLITSAGHLAATTGATAAGHMASAGHVASAAHGVGGAVSGQGAVLHGAVVTAKGFGAKAGLGLGAKLAIAGVATVAVGGGSFVAIHAFTASKPPPVAVSVSVAGPLSGGQLATALLPQSAFPSGNMPIGNLVYQGDGHNMAGAENAGTSSCDNLMPDIGFTGYVYKVGQTAFAGEWVGGNTEPGNSNYASEFLQEVLQFDSAATADTYFQQIRTRMTGCADNKGYTSSAPVNGYMAITSQYSKTVQTPPTTIYSYNTVQPLLVRDHSDVIIVAAQEGRARIDFSNLSTYLPVLAAQLVTNVDTANAHPGPAITSTPAQQSTTETTTQPATTTTPASGPAAVLQAYITAINNHDYQTAWTIGGSSTQQDYTTFAQGFANTDHDMLTIDSVQGDTVVADLTAVQTDGTQHTYHGTYTIANNTITHATVQQTG
ncbi:MAG TPA: ATP-binding protein [Pseudonocardiaceae bacterium]|nr:ATP-binding protein [Pseudonocardiaceae bacterium]